MAAVAAAAPAGSRHVRTWPGGARAPATVIIGVLGVHDRGFALAGFSAPQLWRRQPDALWLPHPDHTEMLRQILDSPEFRRDYLLFPDAFTFGFAVRRSSPRFAGLMAAFEQRWRVAYPGLQPEVIRR
jgi:hypothetical protein